MNSRLFAAVVILLYTRAYAIGEPKTTVIIKNTIAPDSPLTVHCRSADDELGIETLQKGKTYSFSFKQNFFGTTLFYCNFQFIENGKYMSKWFDIYDAESSATSSCTQCNWEVHLHAICLRINLKTVECYAWKPKLSSDSSKN